jgi:hypothetical protein
MPAVASAPFFGLAALSGVALLTDTEAARASQNPLVRGVRDSVMVQRARRYTSVPLFLILCGLTVLTYLASSGKIHGVVGKVLRAGEAGTVTPVYALLALGAFTGTTALSAPPKVAQMGFGVPSASVLALGVGLGLGAMMMTRLAFDVLIWLIPVPLIDLVFETLKKVVSIGIFVLCLISPALAAALAVVLLVVSLLVYGWAVRVVGFAFRIVLRPWLARLVPSLRSGLLDARLAARHGSGGKVRLAVPATALALRGTRKRQAGALVLTEDRLAFVTASWLGRVRSWAVVQGEGTVRLQRGLLWIELQAPRPDSPQPYRLALPKTLAADYDRLCLLLGAEDGGSTGGARLLQKLGERLGGLRGEKVPGQVTA